MKDAHTASKKRERRNKKYIELRTKEKKSNREASETVGFSKLTGRRLWKRYETNNEEACIPQYKGRRRKLSREMETAIGRAIRDKTPKECGLESFLWSKEAIRSLIDKKYNIDLSLSSVAKYLNSKKILALKQDRTVLSNNSKISSWLNDREINGTKDEKLEIHWFFEEIEIKKHKGSKDKLNMIASISNQGKFRFLIYQGDIKKSLFYDFV